MNERVLRARTTLRRHKQWIATATNKQWIATATNRQWIATATQQAVDRHKQWTATAAQQAADRCLQIPRREILRQSKKLAEHVVGKEQKV